MRYGRRSCTVVLVALCHVGSAYAGSIHPIVRPLGGTLELGPFEPPPVVRGVALSPFDGLEAGSDHIIAQQCNDGGFGWPHDDCSVRYHNITAPILTGVLDTYRGNSSFTYLLAALDGGIFDVTSAYSNGESRFGTFTPRYMLQLSKQLDNVTFANFVTTKLFDELTAGTYGPDDLDTAGWIAAVQVARTGTWVNLRPWEFHTLITAAAAAGQAGQPEAFEQGLLDGLDTLDNTDPDNVYSDIIGLAGAVRGLAFSHRFSFPAISAPLHAGIDGIDNLADLTAYLASLQNPDGSWYHHSNLTLPTLDDEDVQSTAYALLALTAVDPLTATSYRAATLAGRDWILSLQGPDGGIPSFPGGTENTEVEGEALSAILAVTEIVFSDGFESGNVLAWTSARP